MAAHQLEPLTRNLALVDRWISGTDHSGFVDRLNSSEIKFERRADEIDLPTFQKFAGEGNEIEMQLESGGWHARLFASEGPAILLEASGPYEEGFEDEPSIEAANAAVRDQNSVSLLRLWNDRSVKIGAIVRNQPDQSGFDWCRTTPAFIAALTSPSWLGAASDVWAQHGRHRLVLQDAADAVVQTPGAVLHGPDVYPAANVQPEDEQAEAYRGARFQDQRKELPTPPRVIPNRDQPIAQLYPILIGLADQLIWCWLAREVVTDAQGMIVRFEGARVVEFRLAVRPIGTSITADIELWRWAISSTDPAQLDAVQQALSLAIGGPDDLALAARPALRTARTLYELARRGAVAEAMATRRSAREGAVTTANDAATAASDAAAKTFDRVVVQLAAIAGILVAQATNLIRTEITRNLLTLVAALVAVLAILVFSVDFPDARARLRAFGEDLSEYRDTLSEDDLTAVRGLRSIAMARKAIGRAQIGTGLLLVIVFLFALVVRSRVT